jgi:diadenosine tetraphosphate (Ap4A) HIT family hydrolase
VKGVTMNGCALCDPKLGPILVESGAWRTVLNRNQNLLGKCFIATRRHIESAAALTSGEWTELHDQLALATCALDLRFQPDHFNYAFLQNQDRHVHRHVIPRYAKCRVFGGERFDDPDYPDHYAVPSTPHILTAALSDALAAELRRRFVEAEQSIGVERI